MPKGSQRSVDLEKSGFQISMNYFSLSTLLSFDLWVFLLAFQNQGIEMVRKVGCSSASC